MSNKLNDMKKIPVDFSTADLTPRYEDVDLKSLWGLADITNTLLYLHSIVVLSFCRYAVVQHAVDITLYNERRKQCIHCYVR